MIADKLKQIRNGQLNIPAKFENRFHILKHTNFLVPYRNSIGVRNYINTKDRTELELKLTTINNLSVSYDNFDGVSDPKKILKQIALGSWGKYFDGIQTLPANVVSILTNEEGLMTNQSSNQTTTNLFIPPKKYPFRKRKSDSKNPTSYALPKQRIDPEITRIRRQKSNLTHKLVLQQLEEYLEKMGCEPVESEHIDLFVQIPKNGKFLFEVKSITNSNLLSQTRKGISQLYEYRFRYQDEIGYGVHLCLVFPHEPIGIDWLTEYVCEDREIGIIWFSQEGQLMYAEDGKNIVKSLIN